MLNRAAREVQSRLDAHIPENAGIQQYYFDEAAVVMANFELLLDRLLELSGDDSAVIVMTSPDPIRFYFEPFRYFPAIILHRTEIETHYRRFVMADVPDPIGLVFQRLAIFPCSRRWGFEFDRDAGVGILTAPYQAEDFSIERAPWTQQARFLEEIYGCVSPDWRRSGPELIEIAENILLGVTGIIDGARQIERALLIARNRDAQIFSVFEQVRILGSDLVVGEERALWAPSALVERDVTVREVEDRYRSEVFSACEAVLSALQSTFGNDANERK